MYNDDVRTVHSVCMKVHENKELIAKRQQMKENLTGCIKIQRKAEAEPAEGIIKYGVTLRAWTGK